jgi:hypothetical protein
LAKLSQQGPRSYWRRALSHHLKRQLFFPNRNSETLLGKPSPTGLESPVVTGLRTTEADAPTTITHLTIVDAPQVIIPGENQA